MPGSRSGTNGFSGFSRRATVSQMDRPPKWERGISVGSIKNKFYINKDYKLKKKSYIFKEIYVIIMIIFTIFLHGSSVRNIVLILKKITYTSLKINI